MFTVRGNVAYVSFSCDTLRWEYLLMNKLWCSVAVLAALGAQTVWAQDVVQAPYGPDGTWVIYELGDDLLTWADALAVAQSRTRGGVAGDLASVHNIKENQVISDLALNGIVWIGLTDREGAAPQLMQNGHLSPQESIELEFGEIDVENAVFAGWAWTSGEPFTYHNWPVGGEPNNWDGAGAGFADVGFEDATFIRADTFWNDAPGGYAEDEPVVPTLQPGTSTEERDGLPNVREYDYVIEYRTNSPSPFPGIDEVGEDLDPEDELPPHISPPGDPFLQAGDADQDLDFDQLDLVQVQIAAKYLSGQAAAWGEGDWNGAPGGKQGNPPAGNGLFDQIDIISALGPGHYLTGPYAALAGPGIEGDGQTSVVYDPNTGEVAVDAPAGMELTSINIDSAGGIFTGDAAANLGGSFDNDADNNIFKATFGGSFGSLSFGNVAQAGLSEDFLLNDLSVVGSLAGGGDLGNVDLVYVPEPSTIGMLLIAMVLGLGCFRRVH